MNLARVIMAWRKLKNLALFLILVIFTFGLFFPLYFGIYYMLDLIDSRPMYPSAMKTKPNNKIFTIQRKGPLQGHIVKKEDDFAAFVRPEEPTSVPVLEGAFGNPYTDDDGRIFIPPDSVLQYMDREEVEDLYYRYIENIQVICPRNRHIGSGDNMEYICETALPRDCLAYSFGNHPDYSFVEGLRIYYNCEVHIFDPNDDQAENQHRSIFDFHRLGLSGHDEVTEKGLNFKTFNSIRRLLQHDQRSLDYLRIDIEGGEWRSLEQIVQTKALEEAGVKLLVVEFHMAETDQDLSAYLLRLRILQSIYNSGLRIYYFRTRPGHCSINASKSHKKKFSCHEIHFMIPGRKRFLWSLQTSVQPSQ